MYRGRGSPAEEGKPWKTMRELKYRLRAILFQRGLKGEVISLWFRRAEFPLRDVTPWYYHIFR